MTWRTATAATLLLLTATAANAQWRDGGPGGPYAEASARAWPAAWGPGRFGPGGRRGGGGMAPGGYGGGRFGGGVGGYGGDYAPRAYGGGGGFGRPDAAYGLGGGAGGWRRGQVLPPAARGAYVPDPGRYHLRAAPPGYGWVGDGRDAYLTQRSTGLVLDHVPRAYEPAPAWRGGRGRGPR